MPCPPLRSVVRRFWCEIGEGRTLAEAAGAVGVSMHTGRLWFADVGGVKPIISEPKSTGPRRRLTLQDRVEIEIGVRTNESLRSIGQRLDRPASTIKYEIDANATKNCSDGRKSGYRRKEAFGARQSGKTARVALPELSSRRLAPRCVHDAPRLVRLAEHERLREEVQTRLEDFHSPTQIAVRLRREFADDPEMWVSPETIYQSIYVQGRGHLRRDLHKCLRTGRALRKPHRRPGERRGRIPDMVNISERPPEVDDRRCPGIGKAT